MLNKLLALTVTATFVASANAAITASGTETWGLHEAEPVNGTGGGWGYLPQSGIPYYNFRLMVHPRDVFPGLPDDWTAAGLELTLDGPVHFYQDPLGGTPPTPGLFPGAPDLEYDTYYTSPGDWPNAAYDGAVVGIAVSDDGPTRLQTDWFDTIDTGNGDWYIASITVVPDDPGDPDFMGGLNWSGDGLLRYTCASTGGVIFDYSFTIPPIPEPGGLALLALGALAAFRRR